MNSGWGLVSVISLLGALVLVTPALWRRRHDGRIPLHVALWLAIALALGLLYRLVGPL